MVRWALVFAVGCGSPAAPETIEVLDPLPPGTCGGGDAHGVTSGLSTADLDALVAFLETL